MTKVIFSSEPSKKSFLLIIFCLALGGFSIVNGQTRKINLANETIELNDSDTLIGNVGNDYSGELQYRSSGYITKINYEGGSKTKATVYHPNGQKLTEYHFKESNYHGPFFEWTSFGKPKKSGSYHEGLEDGFWTFYYFNGVKECEGAFIADTAKSIIGFTWVTKTLSIYNPGEERDSIIIHPKHSPPHGEWNFFDRNGELNKTLLFEYGLLKEIHMAIDDSE